MTVRALLIAIVLVPACSLPRPRAEENREVAEQKGVGVRAIAAAPPATTAEDAGSAVLRDPVARMLDEALRRMGLDESPPETFVERVRGQVKAYTSQERQSVVGYLMRKAQYFPGIQAVFGHHRLPPELAYVAVLESGLEPAATKSDGRRGLWLLSPAAARQFNLAVRKDLDERIDPKKATEAAANYFADLAGLWGGKTGVLFSIGSYGVGEGRLMGAMRKVEDPTRSRDFWYAYERGYFGEELADYLSRAVAIMIVMENPREFGLPDR